MTGTCPATRKFTLVVDRFDTSNFDNDVEFSTTITLSIEHILTLVSEKCHTYLTSYLYETLRSRYICLLLEYCKEL